MGWGENVGRSASSGLIVVCKGRKGKSFLYRALLNKRLRISRYARVRRRRVTLLGLSRPADAGSFAGGQSPPTPPRALGRAFVYSSMQESRFLGHYRYL